MREPFVHHAFSARRGNYTACGRHTWYTRTRWTPDEYSATCPKCKTILAAKRRRVAASGTSPTYTQTQSLSR